ncbi:hypothetical protein [Mycolicibacterium mageritense]|uniref:hypothetical protein n=1 Tax=Mycolicibacterium mageritense TaxID=53462 RepID=UPI000938D2E8|nr:hypothetical protein [Mycolicibacterium mageritense]OKH62417.1 hypothetical protein EB73_27770 [Mycobacterium sp. SWH-M3]GJJ24140.1 hypothetical protein MTY414_78140 [Mycolicibacterium mageritense]
MSDSDDVVRAAVHEAIVKRRQTGVRFKPHGIVNALAAQRVKVTLTAVKKLRDEIERELGPMSPAERRRKFSNSPMQSPNRTTPRARHQNPTSPSDGDDENRWPTPLITLTYAEYMELCENFREDTDEEVFSWIDLVYRVEESDPPFIGFPYGEDANRRIDLGTFAIVLTDILAQRAANEGRTSAYDPDLPLTPLEIWAKPGGVV